MKKKLFQKTGSVILVAALALTQMGWNGSALQVKADTGVNLADADFTGDLWSDGIWTVTPNSWDNSTFEYFTYANDQWMSTGEEEGTSGFRFWMGNGGNYMLTQYVDTLPAGTYTLSSYAMGSGADVSIVIGENSGEAVSLLGYNNWQEISDSFEIEETLTNVQIGFYVNVAADGWGYLDHLYLEKNDAVEEETAYSWKATDFIVNGDFEAGDVTGWEVSSDADIAYTVKTDEWASNHSTQILNLYNGGAATESITLSQKVQLKAGTYKLAVSADGDTKASGITITVGDAILSVGETGGWDVWNTVESGEFTLLADAEVTVMIQGELLAGYWGDIDDVILYAYTADVTGEDDEPVESTIYVDKVALNDDFITGADISSYLSLVDSGVKFYDYDGNELDKQGFFNFLAENGTNWVRIRVWNNPYDAAGNGYGGGNNDLAKAIEMGQYATKAGMRVLIDFHYSDFWADPGKQQAPKAWEGMTLAEKKQAVSTFTTDSMNALLKAGVDVGMVQIGNETTSKFIGESNWTSICTLFSAGASAVRSIDSDILVAIHFTNPERANNYASLAATLDKNGVDYDVFASSYYPYWHGTLSNLTSVLSNVANTYNKKVMVAETSWAYTLADGDGHDNTVRKGSNDSGMDYDFSVQGQANEISAVVETVNKIPNGIGVFYWEAAWLPVQYAYDENGKLMSDVLSSNKKAWEKDGSGWASSYAGEYDAKDAGAWFGGSAVDNQAWFDFEGKPLETARIYNLIRTGATTPVTVSTITVEDITVELSQADAVALPETALVTYNTGKSNEEAVAWEADALQKAIASGVGAYEITGSVTIDEEAYEVKLTLVIVPDNLLINGGFESGLSGWTVSGFNTSDAASNSRTGSGCMHFYSSTAGNTFTATQEVILDAGIYELSAYLQGGDAGEDEFKVAATVEGEELAAYSEVSSWKVWSHPTVSEIVVTKDQTVVTVTLSVSNTTAGVWGSFDDVALCKVGEYEAPHVHEAAEAVKENVVEATCFKGGTYDSVVYCKDCNEELSRETISTPSKAQSVVTKVVTTVVTIVKTIISKLKLFK